MTTSLIAQLVKNLSAMQETPVRFLEKGQATHSSILGLPLWLSWCKAGDLGSIPGLGRSPGEGISYPLQYSGLENSMDCTVHGVTKSRTRLSDFHFTAYMSLHASTHHYGISNFTVLKIFCAVFLPFSPLNSWPPVICLWFPQIYLSECYMVGLILYVAFLHCFLSLSNTHLSFIHSVHDLKAHFCLVLSNTLTSKCTTVYPFTYLEGLLNCFQDLAINEESCSN